MTTLRLRSISSFCLACAVHGTVAAAGAFPAVFDVASLEPENGGDGSAGIVLHTSLPGSPGFNLDAALIADLDGDGIGEVALGAPALHNPDQVSGAGFIVFGGASLPARVDLDSLEGSDGFRVDLGNGDARQDSLGRKVAAAGDLDADGNQDLLIASNRSVFVVFGHADGDADFPARLDLGAVDGSTGVRIDMGSVPPHFNARIDAIGPAGDLDRDGIDDLFAGNALWRTDDSAPNVGALHAIFGRRDFPAVLSVTELDGSNGFRITGDSAHFELGAGGLSATDDIDGDGLADLVANDNRRGIVLFGTKPPFAASRDLPAPDGGNGFLFSAGSDPEFNVAAAGDLDGDGWPDVVFSELVRSYTGPWVPGRTVFVVFGHPAPYPATLDAGDLDGGNGFRYLAEPDADLASAQATMAGDLNGDGIDDLAVFSERCCSAPLANRSIVHVVFGRRAGFPAQMDESMLDGDRGFRIIVPADQAGASGRVAGGIDVNADGIDDLVVAINRNEGVFPGHPGDFAFVVHGRELPLFANGFESASTPPR
jgi:hypothetical protein